MKVSDHLRSIEIKLDELLDKEIRRIGYLDIRRSAEYLSLSQKTVRRLVSKGKIPGYRVEGKILIPLADLETFVQKQSIEVVDIKGMAEEIMKKIKSAEG